MREIGVLHADCSESGLWLDEPLGQNFEGARAPHYITLHYITEPFSLR